MFMKSSYSVMLPHLTTGEKQPKKSMDIPDDLGQNAPVNAPDLSNQQIAELLPDLLNSFAPKMSDPNPQSS